MASVSGNKMSLSSCVSLIIGACVGSAIFSISGITLLYAGASAIISWITAAAIYGLYGLTVSMLAQRFPRSGGIYVFPRLAFNGPAGRLLAWFSAWGYVVSNIIATAFSAIYFGVFLCAGFPGMNPVAGTVASLLVCLGTLMLSGRHSQRVQNALVAVLVAALALFCAFAFFGKGAFHPENFSGFFSRGTLGRYGFVSAIPLAMVSYGGCVAIAFVAAEVRNPERNIRLSLFLGLGAVTLLYVAFLCAIIGTLPLETLLGDEHLWYTPAFASVSHGSLGGYPFLAQLVSVCGCLALLTTEIALTRINARALQEMSRDGLLPRCVQRENGNSRPYVAYFCLIALCLGASLLSGCTELLINLGAVLNIVSMTITCAAAVRCASMPDKRRKSAGLMPAAVAAVLWACYIPGVASGKADMWIFTAAVYAVGAGVYLVRRKDFPVSICGTVVHGKGHGHLHGMPTANLQIDGGSVLPENGVWATTVYVEGIVKAYRGLTNVGTRPSDDDSPEITVETFITDFSGDLYDKRLRLDFNRYIRPTRKFDGGLDELRGQIEKDLKEAADLSNCN